MTDVAAIASPHIPPLPPALRTAIETYYTRYYHDTLGIPGWRALVDVRLDDVRYESARLARLEAALASSVRGLRVLDVGCGPGGFDVVARAAGARVVGVDAAIEAVTLARARAPAGPVAASLAEALPFSASSFDVVYCFSTLEHVADQAHTIAEMVRVLAPRGRLYVHAPNRWACFEGHYKIFWPPGLPRVAAHAYLALRGRPTAFLDTLSPLTLARCRRLVAAAGGRIVRVLDGDAARPVGGRLWPLVRAYYRAFRVHPYLELVVERAREEADAAVPRRVPTCDRRVAIEDV